MSDTVIAVDPDTRLLDVALALRANSIRHVLVIENDKLVGLITDRDIQRCAPSRLIPISEEGYNAVFSDTTVNRVMTRDPACISPNASLSAAMATMQQGRYGCLPVVENDKVVGVLTRGDLLDAFQRFIAGKPLSRLVDVG